MIKQPKDLPSFATTPLFPAGADAWSGQPTRVLPSPSEAAAGVAPNDPISAEWYNAHTGLVLDHLAVLADLPAMNFPEYGTSETDGVIGNSASFPRLISAPDSNGMAWLFVLTSSGVYRSRDGVHWHSGITQPGGTSPISGVASALLFGVLDGTAGNVYVSADGSNTWAGPYSLGSATWNHLAIDQISGSVFAFGPGKVRVSGGGMNSWSAVTIPGSWTAGAGRVVAPEYGATKQGLIALADVGATILTWDGTTWTVVTPGSANAYVAGCWHEADQAWYILTANGELWRSADMLSWALVNTFPCGTCHDLFAFGRNLILVGQNVAFPGGGPCGTVVVTSDRGTSGHVLSPHQPLDTGVVVGSEEGKNAWTRITTHDGRLILARVRATASPTTRPVELAMGWRVGLPPGRVRI